MAAMSELTTSQAAERLSVGISTVRLWCQQGRFPHARAQDTPRGVVWLIPENDLNNFEKPRRGAPPKPKTEAAPSFDGRVVVKRKRAAKRSGKG